MKKKTLSEQVVNLIEQIKTPKQEARENLEFIDVNKDIEKMLTAKSSNEEDKIKITLQV